MGGRLGSLDELPVKDGFRLRGLDMTRIETFTDAAFAFALTLLVLSSTAPTDLDSLKTMLRDIPVFLFGAANLMVFWHGHNEWSRRFGLDDFATMLLSALLVCTILIYVYPLRFVGNLFAYFVGSIAGLPFGTAPKGVFQVTDVNAAFVIYGAGFIANGVVLILLNAHAWRNRDELQLNALERHSTLAEIGAWVLLCLVGLVSVTIGALMPRAVGMPGMAYMLLPILMPIYGITMSRRKRLFAEQPGQMSNDPSHKQVLRALGADKT